MTLNPGDTLYNDQHGLLRRLGRGVYGFVYRARETPLAQEVAIEELISGLVGGVADRPYPNYLEWVGERAGSWWIESSCKRTLPRPKITGHSYWGQVHRTLKVHCT